MTRFRFGKLNEAWTDGAVSGAAHGASRRHFNHNTVSVLLIFLFGLLGLGAAMMEVGPGVRIVTIFFFVAVSLLFLFPYWPVALALTAVGWGLAPAYGEFAPLTSLFFTVSFLFAPGVGIVKNWDKLIVLRLGRFNRVCGPGLVYLIPVIDVPAGKIDTRIRVTDFSAEKSLTLDTVPVHIDALAFWLVWDTERAVLEVQDFNEAVVLSAQTALRSCIGSHTLTNLLSDREHMAAEIQRIVDAKTNPWGITIISVEFKEIIIPEELEDVLSREAQAERERKSRNILSKTEEEISDLYVKAAERYRDDPVALQLRAMNMIYESMRSKGALILTPAAALESMNLGTSLGAAAFNNTKILQEGSSAGTPESPGDDEWSKKDKSLKSPKETGND